MFEKYIKFTKKTHKEIVKYLLRRNNSHYYIIFKQFEYLSIRFIFRNKKISILL